MVDTRQLAKIALEPGSPGDHGTQLFIRELKTQQADKKLTERIASGLKLIEIEVADLIILTTTSYTSFRDEGLI